jgi:MarR family transcriptional regulator, 2-MHQ and catechol-resistance regulon repressor
MPTHYKGTEQEELALDTMIKFTRANSSFEARMLSHGTLGDLTLSQFGVLEILYHLGPMCQGQLSQKLLKSTGNITMVLDNLEKYGLVRRIRSLEDRRMVMLELTQAGSSLIADIFPRHVAIVVEEMSALTPEEQRVLGALSKKLGMGRRTTVQPAPEVEISGSGI